MRKKFLQTLALISIGYAGLTLGYNEQCSAVNKVKMDEERCKSICGHRALGAISDELAAMCENNYHIKIDWKEMLSQVKHLYEISQNDCEIMCKRDVICPRAAEEGIINLGGYEKCREYCKNETWSSISGWVDDMCHISPPQLKHVTQIQHLYETSQNDCEIMCTLDVECPK